MTAADPDRGNQAKSRRGMLRMVLMILRAALVAYVIVLIAGCAFQRKLIFPASRDVSCTPAAAGLAYEDVWVSVGKERTHGWFVPASEGRGTVLFSHGNAGNISHRLDSIMLFHRLGLDVLIYDYGGYGNSTGKPGEKRCHADARAMWEYLTKERGLAGDGILLFGRSLGGAVAADLACDVDAKALILESTFLSAAKLGQETLPFLPVGLILRHPFHTNRKIARIGMPLLIVHSKDDEIIPYHHGRALYELAVEPKSFLDILGGHNEGFLITGPAYEQGLQAFLGSLPD